MSLSKQHMEADFLHSLAPFLPIREIYTFFFNALLCLTSISKAQKVTFCINKKEKRYKKKLIYTSILNNHVNLITDLSKLNHSGILFSKVLHLDF